MCGMTEQEDGTYRQDRHMNPYPFEVGKVGEDPRVTEQARKQAKIDAQYSSYSGKTRRQLTPEQRQSLQADINQHAEQNNRESLAAGQKPVWKVDKDGNYYLLADPNKEDWQYETYYKDPETGQMSTNDNARG
jgi:uncharacterized iron-regulated membrane protein